MKKKRAVLLATSFLSLLLFSGGPIINAEEKDSSIESSASLKKEDPQEEKSSTEEKSDSEKKENVFEVTRNVDQDGNDFDPDQNNREMAKEAEEPASPKKERRQYLTFKTPDGKSFHIVVTYHGLNRDETVDVLEDVNAKDLSTALKSSENTLALKPKSTPAKPVEEKKSGGMNWIIVVLAVVGVGGFGLWKFKFKDK